MSDSAITDNELLAWLDEQLPVERMAAVEKSLRDSEPLRRRAAALARRRDQGGHSVGEIWRRLRLSCPTRAELGSYLLQTLNDGHAAYVDFHLRTIGCRFCLALFDDLQESVESVPVGRDTRRRRLFESSAGLLKSSSASSDSDQPLPEDDFADKKPSRTS